MTTLTTRVEHWVHAWKQGFSTEILVFLHKEIELLLKSGADVNAINHQGNSALMIMTEAFQFQNQNVHLAPLDSILLKLLRQYGADLNAQNTQGNSSWMLLMRVKGKRNEFYDLSNTENLNTSLRNHEGKTALMIAAEAQNSYGISWLIGHDKALTNLQDNQGKTALMHAAEAGDQLSILYLTELGYANLSLQDNGGKTALIHAINAGVRSTEIIDMLSIPDLSKPFKPYVQPFSSQIWTMVLSTHHKTFLLCLAGIMIGCVAGIVLGFDMIGGYTAPLQLILVASIVPPFVTLVIALLTHLNPLTPLTNSVEVPQLNHRKVEDQDNRSVPQDHTNHQSCKVRRRTRHNNW